MKCIIVELIDGPHWFSGYVQHPATIGTNTRLTSVLWSPYPEDRCVFDDNPEECAIMNLILNALQTEQPGAYTADLIKRIEDRRILLEGGDCLIKGKYLQNIPDAIYTDADVNGITDGVEFIVRKIKKEDGTEGWETRGEFKEGGAIAPIDPELLYVMKGPKDYTPTVELKTEISTPIWIGD